jgi:alpha-ketoglutarate-dependent taurine dioxygenase
MAAAAILDFEVKHLHPFTGAEVVGSDLARPLDPGRRAAFDRLLAERGMLVFRDQRLDPRSFARAVENFGELMPQQLSQFTLPDFPIVGFISNADADRATGRRVVRGEQYHTDHSNYPAPPRATALFGVAIPRTGGDTQFANVQAAFDDLPAATKARLEGRGRLAPVARAGPSGARLRPGVAHPARRRSGGRGGPRGGAGALSCTPQASAFLIGVAVLRRHFQAM